MLDIRNFSSLYISPSTTSSSFSPASFSLLIPRSAFIGWYYIVCTGIDCTVTSLQCYHPCHAVWLLKEKKIVSRATNLRRNALLQGTEKSAAKVPVQPIIGEKARKKVRITAPKTQN